jgi:tetratricopeptide (TPR) repeat protein
MGKVALLIGVGEYQSSEFQDLAAADRDVAAMQDVLVQSGIGGFAEADVTVLLNPEPQGMREALERLFAGRKEGDLVLLYFSGHGVVDDFGSFHLTTTRTDKGLLNSTAIPAGFVHGLMEGRGSKRQVVILDCCFSGAFAKDMKAKGEAVNLQPQLGGKGRAVLTSSSATEYSFEQKEAELSVYTQYVVEGLRTGIADGDGDGWISVDELHEFAQGKVREVAPAMQPKIYAVEEGYKIRLAHAPVGDPRLEYRKEVEWLARERDGQLSPLLLRGLATKFRGRLAVADAEMIRDEVLKPYREFEEKLKQFAQEVEEFVGLPQTQQFPADLVYFQQALGLRDEDVAHLIKGVAIPPPPNDSKPQMTAEDYFTQGVENYDKQNYQGAIADFEQAIKLNPNYARAYNGSGTARKVLGDLQGAIADYDQAIKLKPDYADAYNNRGTTRSDLGDHQGAIADYDKAIQLNPNFALAYNNRGNARLALGDKEGTISDYDQAIKLNPDDADAYFSRGIVRHTLGDHQGAIVDYNQAIKLKPDAAGVYYSRGNAHRELGSQQIAITDYDQAIQINQNWGCVNDIYVGSPSAYNNRGNARHDLGDHQGAIDDYEQAIKLKPDLAEAYYGRGNARRDLGDHQGAIDDYEQAIKLKPDLAGVYISLGNIRRDLGNQHGAIDDYDQAIKFKLDFPEAYYNRGAARHDLGDHQRAIDDYEQAIKFKPDFAEAYISLGNARSNLGDHQGAIENYNQAIKLKPDAAGVYYSRGNACRELGNQYGAIDDYDQAIKLNPDFADAYANRGIARNALGDHQGAIDDYDQAIKLKPDYANSYYGRAYTRAILGDKERAIVDYQKAINLYPSDNPWRQKAIDELKKLQ